MPRAVHAGNMTSPRRVLAGSVSLVTRRCSERRLFLRPSEIVNQVLLYILAVAAKRFGVIIHAVCVLSNHLHIVVTDPRGCLPAFQQYMDSLVARSINALHGHWESFWSPGSFSSVTLITPEDMLEKIAYVLANPVKAGLVRHGREWPGLWSAPELIGAAPILVKRPDHFFRNDGPMPETAELEFVCPSGFESVEQFRKQLGARLIQLEDEAAQELEKEGRSFMGVRRVLAQRPGAWPKLREPRMELNPRIACKDKWKRIEAIQRLKEFLQDYRVAWKRFAGGLRNTVFPYGTYGMRLLYQVRCAASG